LKFSLRLAAALGALLCPLGGTAARAQAASPQPKAEMHFTFEDPQLHPVRYSIQIAEDGSGWYESTAGGPLPADKPNTSDGTISIFAPDESRAIHVSATLSAHLFQLARRNKLFAIPCQSHGKVAFNGSKTLEYHGPEGEGSCSYKWTKLKDIDQVTAAFQGIALTVNEGARLALEQAHRPLALDKELDWLTQMVRQGDALELGNIAPVLRAIASDNAVLKRDQRSADALLAGGKAK
jgi:hypothetical protein